MMLNFQVWTDREGNRRLFVVDTSRYDGFYGFYRFVKEL